MEETIDIAEARADDPEALRTALVDQFGHLVDEVTALRTVVDGLPDEILGGRPEPDALTMKELYGAIATLDAEVRRPRVDRVVSHDEPVLSPVDVDAEVYDAGWNERAIDDILREVKAARRALAERLEGLPLKAWHRAATLGGETLTLFGLVHRMTKSDFQRLRDLGYRLHGAHLSDEDEPLPT
ncbi:DinB family protein [Salinibacter altiplanensis]|uniref:DinB family protein n=1 Tax=Salinibacter altiplanensis TaxID=1803181 RepID=UPI001F32BF83|nr:DinB family protein [Salinibacter altiplanensis]